MLELSNALGRLCLLLAVGAAPSAQAQVTTPIDVVSTGLCMDVNKATTVDGEAVIQWGCSGNANQQWRMNLNAGFYAIVATHSNKCLDVFGAATSPGTQVVQWVCNAGANQQFSLRTQGAGYALVARHSGLCLGIESAAATRGARVVQQTCNGMTHQTWRLPGLATRNAVGEWSALQQLSIVPVAAANLPNGNLLFWSAYERFAFGGNNGRTYTLTYNPNTGASSEALVINTQHDMFCPGTALLADGRVHVSGGSSSDKTSLYNAGSNSWSTSSALLQARGYHAAVTLSNSDVFVIGGSWSGGEGNKNGEVWSAATGAWRRTQGILDDPMVTSDVRGIYRADNHAWLFAASGNRVFHAGPSRRMNWFDTDGNGTVTNAGNRGADDTMNGNAVMFAPNRILTLGGAIDYDGIEAVKTAHVIDIAASPVTVRQVGSMAYSRAFHNSVVLPDGKVVVIGGQAVPLPFSDDRAVLVPELWEPASETFRALAPMAAPRTYHSVALLLPDGRVLSGGGGLCGGCTTNHPDVQIFSPPYLFNASGAPASRPAITGAPSSIAIGSSVTVTTNRAVTRFALMRLASVTHSVNNDQRRIDIGFTANGANSYSLRFTNGRGAIIPGYYMLFALDGAGVPSVSRTVRVQ